MEKEKQLTAPVGGNLSVKTNITATIRDAETGDIKRVYKHKNLVATVGRSVFAQILSNDLTYTGVINYGALGTGTTPPTSADTTLETEVFRKAPASQTASANVSYNSFFYTAIEVDGTFKEFGTFIDGTASVDTGQLFNKVAVNWVKTNTETLTVDVENTLT